MAEDEERREGLKRSGRRDPARTMRRDPPVIEGHVQEVTPVESSIAASVPRPDIVEPVGEGSAASAELATPEVAATPADGPPETVASLDETARADVRSAHDSVTTGDHQNRWPLWGSLAALGFIVLAGGLIYLFSQLSSLPPDNSAAVSDLRARLTALESRPTVDPTNTQQRVDGIEHGLADAKNGLAALGKRVDAVEGSVVAQTNLAGQVGDLHKVVEGLAADVAGIKASIASLPRPDNGRIEARLGELDQRIVGLQSTVSGIPHTDLGPLTGQVDALEARLKPVEAETSAARSPEQVAERRAAPVAVTAQAISGAIEAGQAFPKELQALQALGADPAKLAPLMAVADNGAPSLHDLQATLAEWRDRVVSQGAAPPSGSYVDRLMAGASSLVQVRPMGSVVGDAPAAIVARMQDAIGLDDLGAALSEWHRLPEASQRISKALADRIKLRLDAEQAAKDIAANAIGAMALPRG